MIIFLLMNLTPAGWSDYGYHNQQPTLNRTHKYNCDLKLKYNIKYYEIKTIIVLSKTKNKAEMFNMLHTR